MGRKPQKTEDSEPHVTQSFNLPLSVSRRIEAAAQADGGRSRSKWVANHFAAFFAAADGSKKNKK